MRADHIATSEAGVRKPARRDAPPALADVALIDGPAIAAAGCFSISQWLDWVRRGEAPQPVIRQPRFTRWRLADVRDWLTHFAERGSDPQAATAVMLKARRASAAARSKRQVAAQAGA